MLFCFLRRDNSLTKMEPSKEFGSFSALLAPALLANNNNNKTIEETTTTTTKRTTTETKKEEVFSNSGTRNNNNNSSIGGERGSSSFFSTTITTPVKDKAKEASFLLSDVTTKAPQPFRISEDGKKESTSSLFSSKLNKKDSSSKEQPHFQPTVFSSVFAFDILPSISRLPSPRLQQ